MVENVWKVGTQIDEKMVYNEYVTDIIIKTPSAGLELTAEP